MYIYIYSIYIYDIYIYSIYIYDIWFSISYMGCHPKPIDEVIFFRMVKTTNQP